MHTKWKIVHNLAYILFCFLPISVFFPFYPKTTFCVLSLLSICFYSLEATMTLSNDRIILTWMIPLFSSEQIIYTDSLIDISFQKTCGYEYIILYSRDKETPYQQIGPLDITRDQKDLFVDIVKESKARSSTISPYLK